jgi:hypothetical protein
MVNGLRSILVLAGAMLACGQADPNSLNGTVKDQSLHIESAVVYQTVATVDSPADPAQVVLSTDPDLCAHAAAGQIAAGSRQLTMILTQYPPASRAIIAGGRPTAPATFPIYQGPSAPPQMISSANFDAFDKACASSGDFATSGMVQLSGVSGDALTGSYDLTFSGGDHVTGTFKTTSCPLSKLGLGATCF